MIQTTFRADTFYNSNLKILFVGQWLLLVRIFDLNIMSVPKAEAVVQKLRLKGGSLAGEQFRPWPKAML